MQPYGYTVHEYNRLPPCSQISCGIYNQKLNAFTSTQITYH